MTRHLKSLGLFAFVMAAAVLVIGISAITPDVLAQNATGNASSEGLGVPQNATGAQSSPEAMNNTLTRVGPENETVISN